jgi:MFS family permease
VPQSRNILLPALIVGSSVFMQAFDSTAINTALPDMARSLNVTPVSMNLAITSYLIAGTSALPLSGWLADRIGARRAFSWAVLTFALSSSVCAFSGSLYAMVIARIVQGCAGALLLPVGRIITLRSVPPHETVRAMSALTTPVVIGTLISAPVGGLIVTYLSWRWIFLINLPLCGIFLLAIQRFIAPVPPLVERRFDGWGTALVTIALTCSTVAIAGGTNALTGWSTIALLGAGIGAAALYVRQSRNRPDPALDLTLFQIRTFTVVALGGLLGRSFSRSGPFLLALLFQIGFGFSAAVSGLYILCSACGSLVARAALVKWVAAVGFRSLLLANAWLVALTFAASALLSPATAIPWVLGLMFVQGFTRSVQMVALASLTFADIPSHRVSDASILASIATQLAGVLGITISVLALHLIQTVRGQASMATADIKWAFVAVALISLVSIPCYRCLSPTAGANLTRAATDGPE